jgi:MFS family permease
MAVTMADRAAGGNRFSGSPGRRAAAAALLPRYRAWVGFLVASGGRPPGPVADHQQVGFPTGQIGLSLIGLCFVTSFAAFAVMVSVIAIAETGTNVVFGALLAGVLGKEDRVKISATMRSVFNGGFAVGAGLGGVILALDSRAVHLAALGGYGVVRLAIAAARFWLPHVPPAPKQDAGVPRRSALRDVPYVVLGQVSNVYVLCDKILLIGIPLWIVWARCGDRRRSGSCATSWPTRRRRGSGARCSASATPCPTSSGRSW